MSSLATFSNTCENTRSAVMFRIQCDVTPHIGTVKHTWYWYSNVLSLYSRSQLLLWCQTIDLSRRPGPQARVVELS